MQTVRFAHELALTDPVLQLHLGLLLAPPFQLLAASQGKMASCKPLFNSLSLSLSLSYDFTPSTSGTKHQRTLDMRRSMLSCEPARRQVMVGLAHARVVENRVGNNSGGLRGQVVMTAILS